MLEKYRPSPPVGAKKQIQGGSSMSAAKLILWFCAAVFLALSVRFFRAKRPFHALVDLLLAVGIIGVIFNQ
ncbi:hypothetical protein GCWU000246_01496 [Jonquetella anthropi E3_33 E1]|nr:hypothetical protein GCWU000246_01496 [Jonquetella anthropi E3_33 E1]